MPSVLFSPMEGDHMRNTILGLIFIGLCAFSIIQSKQAMGVGEKSRSTNTEVMDEDSSGTRRGTASQLNCYMRDGHEVCDDDNENRSGKIDTVPSDNVILEGTERTESSELGNK